VTSPLALTWIELSDDSSQKNKRKDQPKFKDRIVQTENGKRITEADQDAFLGFQNQKVDRQSVSRNHSTIQGRDATSEGSPQVGSSKNQQKQVPVRALGVAMIPKDSGAKSAQGYTPEWATPGVRPQDSIYGIAESDRTALNTREFVFYGYFQRIRTQLDQAWTPLLRQKLLSFYKQGRTLASDQEHTTQLLVVLNEGGEITRVQVVLESGMMDLDEAAVAAFKKAGPFPHPPRGMSDQNREIKISWDFILKT
jgi:TonB family protein